MTVAPSVGMTMTPSTAAPTVSLPELRPAASGELGAARAARESLVVHDEERDRRAAEALVAQLPARLGTAGVAALLQGLMLRTVGGPGELRHLAGIFTVYLLLVTLLGLVVRRQRRASPALVTLALALDLGAIFIATAETTSPAHYERSLLGTMVVIHVANFYYGRRQAWRVVILGFAAYLLLIGSASLRHLPIEGAEELWTLAIGVCGTLFIVSQAGHIRRRLRTIVTLFERAEQGDFSHTYDEDADHRHDAITRVGRAYNRVRTQLASMVLSDPLTGCLNRRGFEQALAREISRASRGGTELALLVLDLDHFKMVNDTYGHPAGDEVLRAAGRLLLQAARVGDIVARVGGEEFAVLLPTTGADGALHFASRLCDLVRVHPFTVSSQSPTIRVTTSIGVAAVAPRNSRDASGDGIVLARHADMALYAAKRTGRDRARQWDPDLDIMPRTSGTHETGDVIPLGLA